MDILLSLSSEPINVILERLEQEAFAKALEASSEGQSVLDVPEAQMVSEQLWVDEYAPKSFTELLSDEQTNCEVLLWLKQWDSVVFGSEIRSTSDDVLSALKRHSSIVHNQKPLNSKFPRKNGGPKRNNGGRYINSVSMDESGSSKSIQDVWNTKSRNISPPEQKVLLLCGPPGLGKTTLAHVAARHCGYHVVEDSLATDDGPRYSDEAGVVQMTRVEKKENILEKSIGKLKETGTDVWQGTQLLANDVAAAMGLLKRALIGEELTEKEKKTLKRTLTDMASVV